MPEVFEAPSIVESSPPPLSLSDDFGGPNKLMDDYRSQADELQAAEVADNSRPRDEHGRFLSEKPKVEETVEPEIAPEISAKPATSKLSLNVAMAARAAGFPSDWIEAAPSDDFVVLALKGLHADNEAARTKPQESISQPSFKKLEITLDKSRLDEEVVGVIEQLVAHVNAMGESYGLQNNQIINAYGQLEQAYGQIRNATAQNEVRQGVAALDGWVSENPKLAALIGKASDAHTQLDSDGLPTTEQGFRWLQLGKKAKELYPDLRVDTHQGRDQLTKLAKKMWPQAFQGVPERNGKGALPLGASIRPVSVGDDSRSRNDDEAALWRMKDQFAEAGVRTASEWISKTGLPLPD